MAYKDFLSFKTSFSNYFFVITSSFHLSLASNLNLDAVKHIFESFLYLSCFMEFLVYCLYIGILVDLILLA